MSGGSGDDVVSGGNGDNFAAGGFGDDQVLGGNGDDFLTGDYPSSYRIWEPDRASTCSRTTTPVMGPRQRHCDQLRGMTQLATQW